MNHYSNAPRKSACWSRRWAAMTLLGGILHAGCGGDSANDELFDAGKHLTAARTALVEGDTATAMSELDESIRIEPSTWAYIERARLHLKAGDDAKASADIDAGLELTPESRELNRLKAELSKSASSRNVGSGNAKDN